MLDTIKKRLPARPKFRNPFPVDPAGKAAYDRVLAADPGEGDSTLDKMSDSSKEAYHNHVRYASNKRLFYQVTGIALVGSIGTAIVVSLSSEDEEEDDEYDEYDENNEDDNDDNDDDEDNEDD